MKDVTIYGWCQNGNSIWFYIKGKKKPIVVPEYLVKACQYKAIRDFKYSFREMFEIFT